MIFILLSVAYLTLIERHILGNRQLRSSVNKVRFGGLLQPVLDGVKLLTKRQVHPKTHTFLYSISPYFAFLLILLEFCGLSKDEMCNTIDFGLLFILTIVGLITYGVLLGGLIRGSKYAFIGGVRSLLQVISYEVVFTLLLYTLCQRYKRLETPVYCEGLLLY